jgi:hypothetical protein
MTSFTGGADPPRTLAERLSRLNDNLQALGERLKTSIAALVGDAIGDAVRAAVRNLLGNRETPALTSIHDDRDYREGYRPRDDRDQFHRTDYRDAEPRDPWGDDDRRWPEEDDCSSRWDTSERRQERPRRWHNALGAAAQSALWWLRYQPRNRPVLTTLAVALAAGITGFVAGPPSPPARACSPRWRA